MRLFEETPLVVRAYYGNAIRFFMGMTYQLINGVLVRLFTVEGFDFFFFTKRKDEG